MNVNEKIYEAEKIFGSEDAKKLFDRAMDFAIGRAPSMSDVLDVVLNIAMRRGVDFVLSRKDLQSLICADLVMSA